MDDNGIADQSYQPNDLVDQIVWRHPLFAFYSEIVENTSDETVMLTAQNLSSSTLERLGVLEKII